MTKITRLKGHVCLLKLNLTGDYVAAEIKVDDHNSYLGRSDTHASDPFC